MILSGLFNKFAHQWDEKTKYKALAAAIEAQDLAGVKKALAAGANVNYAQFGNRKKQPLNMALQTGNAAIFDRLLQAGADTTFSSFDFRIYKRESDPLQTSYHTVSHLFAAIEQGKDDIALALIKHPAVSVEDSGLIHGYRNIMSCPIKPIDLARAKEMEAVVAAIEERIRPLEIKRAFEMAELKTADAKKLRQAADALDQEAAQLRLRGETLKGPTL